MSAIKRWVSQAMYFFVPPPSPDTLDDPSPRDIKLAQLELSLVQQAEKQNDVGIILAEMMPAAKSYSIELELTVSRSSSGSNDK